MKITIKNVQFIFGTLDKAKKYDEKSEATFFAKFLVHDKKTIAQIENTIEAVATEHFKKVPKTLKDFTFDPNLDKYPEQEGAIVINAKNTIRPKLFGRDREIIHADDGIIYAGCMVNVSISVWAYSNKYNDGVSASLLGIQYYGKGEALGMSADKSDFDSYADEETESPLG